MLNTTHETETTTMTTMTSKYDAASKSFLAAGRDESAEAFEARRVAIVAIADRLDCGVWHAAFEYDRLRTRPICYLCGGTMRDERAVCHALCDARTNRGRTDLPVINYEPTCGCNWEGCDAH